MGLEKELKTTQDDCYATTFTNWGPHPQGPGSTGYVMPEYAYSRPKINRVKDYKEISQDEIFDIIKSPSFFARKFNEDCVVLPGKEKLQNYLKKFLTSDDNHL